MNETQTQARAAQAAENLVEVLLQGTARLIELQTTATQALLRMQSRNAALLGAPDLSQLFGGDSGRQVSELCQAGTEQALRMMRQTNEALTRVQTEVNEMLTRQTKLLTEQIRSSIQEIEQRTEQAVSQVRETTRQNVQQARQTAEDSASALQGSSGEERARAKPGA